MMRSNTCHTVTSYQIQQKKAFLLVLVGYFICKLLCGGVVFSRKVVVIIGNGKRKFKFCGDEDQNYPLHKV